MSIADDTLAVLTAAQADWNSAMASWDAEAASQLYDAEAQMFGSLPALFLGVAGARDYYASFPNGRSTLAHFDNQAVTRVGPDIIAASGFVKFELQMNDGPRSADFRFSFILRRTDRWRIFVHHASPIPQGSPAD